MSAMSPRCSTRAWKKRCQRVRVIIPVLWQEAVARPLTGHRSLRQRHLNGCILPTGRESVPKKTPFALSLTVVGFALALAAPALAQQQSNLILFVADGLRASVVTPQNSPAFARVRAFGVDFVNSHALFPTFTTANASAIATGHYLGDTGDFSNTFYIGQPIFLSGNFGRAPGTYAPYIENNSVLGDLNATFNGNYLNEETLLSAARAQGFNTAAVGKMGPTAIQDVSQLNPVAGKFATPHTVIIDHGTGTADGVPLDPQISSEMLGAGLPTTAPARNQSTGNNTTPGTTSPNTQQQGYFADAVTRVILPTFKKSGKPFVLLYWSRDP